jgi:hypothetical protein
MELWKIDPSRFKVDLSNIVHDFILFKFLKDVLKLTSCILLNALILNLNLSFKMDQFH